MREAPVCRSRSNSSGQLLATCPPAWPELGKNWKTKAPRPQALPAEAWGRKARGRRLRGGGKEGGVVVATPEHKNNEARGAMGPSWLVPESLSDLDRCHSWAPGEEPQPPVATVLQSAPQLPQARVDGGSYRPTTGRQERALGDWERPSPSGVAECEQHGTCHCCSLAVCLNVCGREAEDDS